MNAIELSSSSSERPSFDAHRILGGKRSGQGSLWQGSASTTHIADMHDFQVVVLCAVEWQPQLSSRLEVIRFLSDDCKLTRAHLQEAIYIASKVERRVRTGKNVLVTCFAGLNRSGLVTALAAMKLTNKPGSEVLKHIQARRPGALCNASFANVISKLVPVSR
jgi:hypothetical protein